MNTTARRALRAKLLEQRRALSPAEQHSGAIAVGPLVSNVISEKCNGRAGVVAAYLAYGGEISPEHAVRELDAEGWSVVLPVCGSDGHMEFCPWEPGTELVENRYGIGEPTTDPVDVEVIDAVIVPGVGFDREGNRIGHGVGFYDRFFDRCAQQLHHPYRLGLGYDFQIVDLPAPEPWDIPMKSVVSPSEVIDTTPCE